MTRSRSTRRPLTVVASSLIAFLLVAAACGGDDDDDGTDTAAPEDTEATTDTEAPTDSEAPADTGASSETEAPEPTEPPASEFAPVFGGKVVVAGEAEVANPWTPAAMQCDSYCQMRARTFYDPIAVIDDQLEVRGYLAESIEPNAEYTVFTLKVREGISFHDDTPVNADAVMDNLNRSFSGLLLAAASKDIARNEDGTLVMEKLDDFTFTIAMGKDGNPDEPLPWPTFPTALTTQGGLIASPTWLAAVDAGEADSSEPIGSGPFVYDSYAPGDKLIVKRNENYWLTDENGDALPYLDELEFRVIADSQISRQALQSGDVQIMSTSDTQVVHELEADDSFETVRQDLFAETNHILLHLTKPALADKSVRCALWQGLDIEALLEVTTAGFGRQANAPFSPGQEGYIEGDNGAPRFDPEAAKAAIEAYESANGPVEINYSTTPTATNLTSAQFIQQSWGAIGVDVNIDQIEQSKLINNALFGDAAFDGFGWRNHAGLYADSQFHWWHGSSAAPDGELGLNFARLDDPEINASLEAARSEPDSAIRSQLGEDINRRFASECFLIPTSWTEWGVHSDPAVENIGRTPIPDSDSFMRDGAGAGGQVWLTAVFTTE